MEVSDGGSTRSLSEISEEETGKLNTDLVAAARKNLGFLRLVSEAHWLHQTPTILEAIRRYEQLWIPLIADLTVGTNSPVVLPPLDIEWIWFCHTLNPVSYRKYCEAKFSRVIGKAAIFDAENEDYAINRCRDIWMCRYPREPFEIESDYKMENPVVTNEDLFGEVSKQRFLYSKFAEPYRSEIVYLIAARHRYKGFLYVMRRFADGQSRLVPTSDVLLMWFTDLSYPTTYIKELELQMEKVSWETVEEEDLEETKKLWESIFDEPYEKAGGELVLEVSKYKPPFYWEFTDSDVNIKYKSIVPRFLLEVCLMVKLNSKLDARQKDISHEFLRLRMVRCHRQLKINKTLSKFQSGSWQKAWNLYCGFGTKGVVLEVRRRGGFCSRGSSLKDTVTFYWNDLLRAPSLILSKEIDQKVRVVASITPPIQSSYLLKCVPGRVTDDSGAMISDVILKMNGYRPQEGRWLSRTVLDHAGRECFVVRMRVGGGFWRRGAETPSAVKWEDRIIEIREGSWSYVAGSIGRAPEKVVGTATPKEPLEGWKASWNLSTGDELSIGWEASTSTSASGLSFHLKHETDTDSMIKLVRGRKMQYQVNKFEFECENGRKNTQDDEEKEEKDEGEEGFVTLVRISEENPNGKATALLNWKLLVVELLPEEDAVLVQLLCMSILRSASEMTKEDIGSLLIRRRLKEAKLGDRDWGSVILHPSSYSPDISSPYLLPWHWNAQAVMASNAADHTIAQSASGYSLVEGGDKLYKRGILG